MKLRNKSFFKKSPFRIVISLFMAFFIFFSVSFSSYAYIYNYRSITPNILNGVYSLPSLSLNIPLDHYEYNVLASDPSKPSIYVRNTNNTIFYSIEYPAVKSFIFSSDNKSDYYLLSAYYNSSPQITYNNVSDSDQVTTHIDNIQSVMIVNVNGVDYESFQSPSFFTFLADTLDYVVSVRFRLTFTFSIYFNGSYSSAFPSAGHLAVSNSVNVSSSSFNGFDYMPSDSQSIIDSINGQSSSLVGAIGEQTDTITNGYDSSSGNSSVNDINNAFNAADAAQGSAVTDAQESLKKYSFSDTLKFSADLMAGLSFIYSLSNAFFAASGNFSVLVTAVYCMAFLSIVLGLWRFFRGSD